MARGRRSPGNRGLKKCRLTPRWSGRVRDKVPSPNVGARAAQLNRHAAQAVCPVPVAGEVLYQPVPYVRFLIPTQVECISWTTRNI